MTKSKASMTSSRASMANWAMLTVRHLSFLLFIPNPQIYPQETYSAIISRVGFRLLIVPQIITLHLKHITMARLNGLSKAADSTNGSPLARFCGYMENVCSSGSSTRDIRPDHLNRAASSGKSVL
jgi:hypothetical protein